MIFLWDRFEIASFVFNWMLNDDFNWVVFWDSSIFWGSFYLWKYFQFSSLYCFTSVLEIITWFIGNVYDYEDGEKRRLLWLATGRDKVLGR